MGERTPVALLDAAGLGAAGGRRGDHQHRRGAASRSSRDVKLSANWMAAAGQPGRGRAPLRRRARRRRGALPGARDRHPGRQGLAVDAHGWERRRQRASVTAPLSLIVTAFAPVTDVRRALTPAACAAGSRRRPSSLLVDLGARQEPPGRLGAGAGLRRSSARRRPTSTIRRCCAASSRRVQELTRAGLLLAYHDRSDGGLFVTLVEMAFAGGVGLDIDARRRSATIRSRRCSPRSWARCCRCAPPTSRASRDVLARHGLGGRRHAHRRAAARRAASSSGAAAQPLFDERRSDPARRLVARPRTRMQALRDDPTCADEEQAARVDADDPGLSAAPDLRSRRGRRRRRARARRRAPARRDPARAGRQRPDRDGGRLRSRRLRGRRRAHDRPPRRARVDLAGLQGPRRLRRLLLRRRARRRARAGPSRSCSTPRARDAFAAFFARPDTFALGVCNGCQMMSALKEIIPGAEHWPRFVRNRSEQFEARLSLVEIAETPSVLLRGHGRARACRSPSRTARAAPSSPTDDGRAALERPGLVARALRRSPRPADRALPRQPERLARRHHRAHDADGRVTIFMPHPERVFRAVQFSWRPRAWRRRRPLDADLPQRARLGGLTLLGRRRRRGGTVAAPARAPRRAVGGEPERRRLGARFGATFRRPLAPLRRRESLTGVHLRFGIARVGGPAVAVRRCRAR